MKTHMMESLAVHFSVLCILMLGSLCLGAFKCVDLTLEERVACSITSPNETTCTGMGCCWNPRQPDIKCYTKKGGQCIMYPGASCKVAINTTLLPYRDTPRFVDNKLGIRGTESFLGLVISVINDATYVTDDRCRKILATMLCHYTLPPCKRDGTIRPFCQEDCLAVFELCQRPLNQVIGAVKHIAKIKHIDFVHTGFPNCSRYKPSTSYDMSSNDSCVQTGYFNFAIESRGEEKDDPHLVAIILPVILIILLVIFIVAIFLWRRKKQKKDAMKNGTLILGEGALTMRQKLRADSLKSLDARMLRLYDPSKIRHYPLDNVEYLKDLGEGHFGKVFQGRAVGIIEGQPKKEILVAVKALKEGSSKELKEEFYQEVALMSIFQHPNIVSLIAVSTEEEPYGMIFEYMTEGDLNHYLRMAKPAEISVEEGPVDARVFLSQEDIVYIAEQIAAGMEYVASLKFVHRDLAARNCLVGKDLQIKIADFGMSRDVYQSDYYKMSRETLLPIRWLAPEAFLYGKFTVMSDVYSYGVVLWEIYTFGLQPYYGYTNKEVTEFIMKGIHLGKPDYCPDYVYNIMKDCWMKDPRDRPGFDDLQKRLQDPFGNYDAPKSKPESLNEKSDQSINGDQEDQVDSGSQDIGNYDVPRSPLSSRDDIDKEHEDAPKQDNEFGTYDVPRDNDNGNYDVPRDNDNGNYDVPRDNDNWNYDVPKDNAFGSYDVPKDEFGAYDVPNSPPSDGYEDGYKKKRPQIWDPTEKKRSTRSFPVQNSVEV